MLRGFTRLPLRKCVHTASSSAQNSSQRWSRYAFAFGASVTAATYLVWSTTSERRKIALDARPLVNTPQNSSPSDLTVESSSDILPSSPVASTSNSSEQLSNAEFTPATPPAEEEEESSGGAFNPVTGEINWDCPCLGGMAHGPCGPEFREAFSCFVYSDKEPKGMDCVEKFRAMQLCFREHPDVYGEEIMDDEEDSVPAGAPETSDGQQELPAAAVPGLAQDSAVSQSAPS